MSRVLQIISLCSQSFLASDGISTQHEHNMEPAEKQSIALSNSGLFRDPIGRPLVRGHGRPVGRVPCWICTEPHHKVGWQPRSRLGERIHSYDGPVAREPFELIRVRSSVAHSSRILLLKCAVIYSRAA
jgi:hypothetical protein